MTPDSNTSTKAKDPSHTRRLHLRGSRSETLIAQRLTPVLVR